MHIHYILCFQADRIEETIGAMLCLSTMAAAGMGNMVSDLAGVEGGREGGRGEGWRGWSEEGREGWREGGREGREERKGERKVGRGGRKKTRVYVAL